MTHLTNRTRRIAFARIADAARANAESILMRWLPDGRREGREWVARNPLRDDQHLGSLKVNIQTTRWADFATDDRGPDLTALASYLYGLHMREAAIRVAEMLGVDPFA